MLPKINKYKVTSFFFSSICYPDNMFIIIRIFINIEGTVLRILASSLDHHWHFYKIILTNHEGVSTVDGVASEFVLLPAFVFASMLRSQVDDACGSASVVDGQNERVHNQVHEAEIQCVQSTFGQNMNEFMNSRSSNLFTHNTLLSASCPIKVEMGSWPTICFACW